MNYNIVFLLEESSIENVLNELLPKIIPPEISYIGSAEKVFRWW
jgi:hypothetical protein